MAEAWDGNLGAEVEVDGDDVHVTLVGEIDVACSATMQRRLDEVSEFTDGAVVLDMSGVSFIDSTGIRVLVSVRRRLLDQRRSLILRNVSAQTQRVLDLTGLGTVLGVDGTT